jgi:hypothetical protein
MKNRGASVQPQRAQRGEASKSLNQFELKDFSVFSVVNFYGSSGFGVGRYIPVFNSIK